MHPMSSPHPYEFLARRHFWFGVLQLLAATGIAILSAYGIYRLSRSSPDSVLR